MEAQVKRILADAIAQSRDRGDIVTLEVDGSINDVSEALISLESEVTGWDWAEENDGSWDVWGWDEDTHDDEHAWRLRIRVEQGQRRGEIVMLSGVETEQELRDTKVPSIHSEEELCKYIGSLVNRQHDYGTAVYAVSMAATAAFCYVAHVLGISGFQASCADMDILSRTRGLKWGKILDYDNLLYPQYCDREHFPGIDDLMADEEIRRTLRDKAKEKLAQNESAHPDVIKHWQHLSRWPLP